MCNFLLGSGKMFALLDNEFHEKKAQWMFVTSSFKNDLSREIKNIIIDDKYKYK